VFFEGGVVGDFLAYEVWLQWATHVIHDKVPAFPSRYPGKCDYAHPEGLEVGVYIKSFLEFYVRIELETEDGVDQ
jgi:hypothetical protein